MELDDHDSSEVQFIASPLKWKSYCISEHLVIVFKVHLFLRMENLIRLDDMGQCVIIKELFTDKSVNFLQ